MNSNKMLAYLKELRNESLRLAHKIPNQLSGIDVMSMGVKVEIHDSYFHDLGGRSELEGLAGPGQLMVNILHELLNAFRLFVDDASETMHIYSMLGHYDTGDVSDLVSDVFRGVKIRGNLEDSGFLMNSKSLSNEIGITNAWIDMCEQAESHSSTRNDLNGMVMQMEELLKMYGKLECHLAGMEILGRGLQEAVNKYDTLQRELDAQNDY